MVNLQERGVGEEDSRQGEAAELLLRAWEEVQEPQASVEEEGSHYPAWE